MEPLSTTVQRWADANGGELNALQVRELLRELRRSESNPPPIPPDPGWDEYLQARIDERVKAMQD